jgi:hypothetical protein
VTAGLGREVEIAPRQAARPHPAATAHKTVEHRITPLSAQQEAMPVIGFLGTGSAGD